jgi:hypothetical protein
MNHYYVVPRLLVSFQCSTCSYITYITLLPFTAQQNRIKLLEYKIVQRPGREAHHSPPSNAEVKNEWSYTSTPPTSSWRGAWLSTGTTLPSLLHHLLVVTAY